MRIPLKWLLAFLIFLGLPFVFNGDFARGLLVQFIIFGLLGVGLNIFFGATGHIPFGFAAFSGLGAYGSALVAVDLGWPFWASFATGAAVSVVVGLFIGWVSLRLTGAYFAICTYAFMFIAYLVCQNWVSLTRGPLGLIGIPRPSLAGFNFDTNLSYYFLALALLLLCLYLYHSLMRSALGRAILATRENEDLAKSIGISIFKYQVWCLCIASIVAGLSGALYAHYVSVLTPGIIGAYYSNVAVAMVIVGGRSTMYGPLIGSAVFVVLPELFGISGPLRMISFGLITLVCIIALPAGIWPALITGIECLKTMLLGIRQRQSASVAGDSRRTD